MIFSTYTPPPPQKSNALAWVLGICGGCALLAIIVVAVVAVTMGKQISKGVSAIGNVGSGVMKMATAMPKFLGDLKSHDYASASDMVDPEYKSKLTEAKLKAMEEKVEKKLGKMKSFSSEPPTPSSNSSGAPGSGTLGLEYIYAYPVTYEKGTATITFHFKSKDFSKFSGLVTDLSIVEDGAADTSSEKNDTKK